MLLIELRIDIAKDGREARVCHSTTALINYYADEKANVMRLLEFTLSAKLKKSAQMKVRTYNKCITNDY